MIIITANPGQTNITRTKMHTLQEDPPTILMEKGLVESILLDDDIDIHGISATTPNECPIPLESTILGLVWVMPPDGGTIYFNEQAWFQIEYLELHGYWDIRELHGWTG